MQYMVQQNSNKLNLAFTFQSGTWSNSADQEPLNIFITNLTSFSQ